MKVSISLFGQKPLYGKHIILEKYSPSHAGYIQQCYQNDSFMDRYRLAQDRKLSVEQIKDKIKQEQLIEISKLRHIDWVIKKKQGTKLYPIGLASLTDYSAVHQRAEILIGLLQPEHRVSSWGLEATLLVLEFAFHLAKLNKLVSFVYGYNKKAQKNTLHLGFSQEACLQEHLFNPQNKKYIDLFQNRMLSKEFFADKNISRWSLRLLERDITQTYQQTSTIQNIPLENAKNNLLSHRL